jgi:3',5'-cyclic AMP phosphodiesterase CpdA
MQPRPFPLARAAAFSVFAVFLLASCAGVQYHARSAREITALRASPVSWPAVRFSVFSDPHLYDTRLGTEGPEFSKYMDNDRKLLPQSQEILQEAMAGVRESGARFLLVPGDLTKDGERQNHELFAGRMAELARDGIRVYVVPGNHDIFNPHAMRFTAEGRERVPWVSPEEFAEIYRDFGYGDALERDPASLSYLAEPVPGLRLLAICSADYGENPRKAEPKTGGRIYTQTLAWMEKVLGEAAAAGIPVIAMMHHGAMEHYQGQAKYFGEYVVEDYPRVGELLASYGVRMVFTGHYHSQDITVRTWKNGDALYDVETGSLVTYPNPVRSVEMAEDGKVRISTTRITSLPSFVERGEDFSAYSREFTASGISTIAIKTMKGLGVPEAEALKLAGQITAPFIAHYGGDERFTGTEMLTLTGLSFMGGFVVGNRRDLIEGMWRDLEPPDNAVSIDLSTGEWQPEQ